MEWTELWRGVPKVVAVPAVIFGIGKIAIEILKYLNRHGTPNISPQCTIIQTMDCSSTPKYNLRSISLTQPNRPIQWEIVSAKTCAPWRKLICLYDKRSNRASSTEHVLIVNSFLLDWRRTIEFYKPRESVGFAVHPRANKRLKIKVKARFINDPTVRRTVRLTCPIGGPL